MTPVEPRWAPMPPQVALVLVREHDRLLRDMETRAERLRAAGDPGSACVIRLWVRQARASAREWTEAHRQAGIGSTEVPAAVSPSGSSSNGGCGARSGLTTGEAAESLGVSVRRVVQLIDAGRLSAARHRGCWVVDELSVAAEIERRRNR